MHATTTCRKGKIMKQIAVIASLSLLLAACSPDGSTPKIAEDQRDVLDQAKQVESVIEQGAQNQQQQADEQTQ